MALRKQGGVEWFREREKGRERERERGKKILIIDDESELVKAMTIRFKANGYEVITVSDGSVGVDKAGEIKPDLILLDIVMPKMDGHEVCKKLKGNLQTKDIPIVIFTASDQWDLEKKCMSAGATAVFRKPLEGTKVLELINKLL